MCLGQTTATLCIKNYFVLQHTTINKMSYFHLAFDRLTNSKMASETADLIVKNEEGSKTQTRKHWKVIFRPK